MELVLLFASLVYKTGTTLCLLKKCTWCVWRSTLTVTGSQSPKDCQFCMLKYVVFQTFPLYVCGKLRELPWNFNARWCFPPIFPGLWKLKQKRACFSCNKDSSYVCSSPQCIVVIESFPAVWLVVCSLKWFVWVIFRIYSEIVISRR